jgi:hypothetical protein
VGLEVNPAARTTDQAFRLGDGPSVQTSLTSPDGPRGGVIRPAAGDKTGQWTAWYERAIPHAEELYAFYLKERAGEESQ